jgi:hypothetical protein
MAADGVFEVQADAGSLCRIRTSYLSVGLSAEGAPVRVAARSLLQARFLSYKARVDVAIETTQNVGT